MKVTDRTIRGEEVGLYGFISDKILVGKKMQSPDMIENLNGTQLLSWAQQKCLPLKVKLSGKSKLVLLQKSL